MKVFVTGGSGFIGTKVVEQLISKGHSVVGLARSDTSAEKLETAGAKVVRGELTDIDVLVDAAKSADGTMHLGFIHDFANISKSMVLDRQIVTSICEAYKGTDKFFINTSGTLFLHGPGLNDEDTPIPEVPLLPDMVVRTETESQLLSYADKGFRVISIRCPPTVHGEGDGGFIPIIYGMFKNQGASFYPDSGENVWPAVHRADAAKLYVLAAEKAPTGSILHAVAEQGIPIKSIAEAMAKKSGFEAKSVSKDELKEKLGFFFGFVFASNNYVSSEKTKKITGWAPTEATLLEDITNNY
ncbi:hypothetical protein PSN45_000579 [Yamadazyma tenuis]|uniref:NAD-dependent epimerase/dehydratase domain-containing protein n=1 Tax=Candida tenuis (strain ATCC 10573 / BCRC 21748 / CBS 615 / JCM 9827 / NBRC 10315 / NRRL Y-1498 / VKM Y-70) TaxID=590646 RepID=G3B9H2_CANTC|nr:uncharacterized protein CANTEDRAFT_125169 [Yamadazyma tenuis ATCC 10573]EGV61885.1 hypothetical protein CANTEDRAFT_125169 [Yamadazyma tenuis ATCC 10573]WEJ93118.1 hypothetical protein PSN45_000579 [Yamadazyma tenuis]